MDVHWLKSSKLAPPLLKQRRFLTPTSLIFSYADRWFGSPDKVNSFNLILFTTFITKENQTKQTLFAY